MQPELGKVSNCCGDRLVTINESEGTMHYECFNCKKPCDSASDCATCFPQHYPEEHYAHKTVPICEKHAREMYLEDIKKCPPQDEPVSKSELGATLNAHSSNKTEPEVRLKLTTNDKIVKMVKVALEQRNHQMLMTLGDILHKQAEMERLLKQIIK